MAIAFEAPCKMPLLTVKSYSFESLVIVIFRGTKEKPINSIFWQIWDNHMKIIDLQFFLIFFIVEAFLWCVAAEIL